MKKRVKVILRVVIVVAVLLAIGAVLLVLNLGTVLKAAVENGGSMVLNVPVKLDKASVSLVGGSAGMDGLSLGSPSGYDAQRMFYLGHAHLVVQPRSLLSDEIVVREIVVDGAEFTIEWAGGKMNWTALMDQLQGEQPAEKKKEENEKLAKTIRLDRIAFSHCKVIIKGLPMDVPIPLPSLEIKDIASSDGGGVTVRKLLVQIVGALEKSLVGTVKEALSPEQLAKLPAGAIATLGDLGAGGLDAGKAAVKGATEGVGSAAKGAVEGAKGALKGAGGLLGRKKGDDGEKKDPAAAAE